MFRAGLYARVSTSDQQTLTMQNRAMREYAARRGWTIASVAQRNTPHMARVSRSLPGHSAQRCIYRSLLDRGTGCMPF
jgi:hypothetical protein